MQQPYPAVFARGGNMWSIRSGTIRCCDSLVETLPQMIYRLYSATKMSPNQRVWRRRGERFADCCIAQRDRFGGRSVKVWGGICGGNHTRLEVVNGNLNGARYRNAILRPVVVPFLQRRGPSTKCSCVRLASQVPGSV